MITLYDKKECPFCWKIRLALQYKNLNFEELTIDTENKPKDFIKLSPTGKVPLLCINSEVIFESNLILEYIEDYQTQPSLLSDNLADRRLARYLNHYSDTVIGPSIRDAIFTKRGNPEKSWDTEAIKKSNEGWASCLEHLNRFIQSENYFTNSFSYAECALIPRFSLAVAYGIEGLDRFPSLKKWFDFHRSREIFRKTAPPICLPQSTF